MSIGSFGYCSSNLKTMPKQNDASFFDVEQYAEFVTPFFSKNGCCMATKEEKLIRVAKFRVCAVSLSSKLNNSLRAMGSLVARASDSRPEGLGSMPHATKYPPSTHGVRAR
ncbi:hypothetical protein TNCV_1967501 [Trichonephila clavipes]|nr:hypothetical protein TNCV_1967501 [Trichonephila clavipes]